MFLYIILHEQFTIGSKNIKYTILIEQSSYDTMIALLEYINCSVQFYTNATTIYFALPYYAGIMIDAFNDPLCSTAVS